MTSILLVVYLGRKAQHTINIGDRFGSLVVVGEDVPTDKRGYKQYLCLCDCGNYVVKTARYLTRPEAQTHSCGCQRGKANQTHGFSKTDGRLYGLWQAMRWRANPNNNTKATYRQNNIKCCHEWDDYSNFRQWAFDNGYNDTLTLDRIDNIGDYSPDNCRWVNMYVQANNKNNNHQVTFNGETHTIAEWSKIKEINYSTLRSRINRQHLQGDDLFASTESTRDPVTGRFVGGYAI